MLFCVLFQSLDWWSMKLAIINQHLIYSKIDYELINMYWIYWNEHVNVKGASLCHE